jgi:hypothetical protein
MTSFTNVFGNSAISPTDVAYASYSFGSNLILFWPQFANGQPNVAARFMNLTATASSLNVYMPDATLVSVGYDVLVVNIGTNTFNLVSLNGNAIATIAAGQAFYVNLTNNTTQDGTWQVIQFGVGTGAAVAAALAGAGLLAAGGLLEQNILGTTLSGNTALTSTARAILQVWNGGTGTVTLPTAASVGNGFFFPFANDGTGSVTIATAGSDQIDGASTSIFAQSQSAFIVSTGTAWFTVGKGLQNNFSVTVLNLNVAGSANITETSAQAQSIIQQFTGILTGNIQVIMPATPQLYFVYNNTTGPYTLTVSCIGGGASVLVTQGTNTILYCDGTNIVGAFTSSIGSSVSLPVGSAGAPTLNFQGRTTTGLYSPAAGQIAITAGGYEVMNFASATSSVNYLQTAASSTGADVSTSALGSDTNISWDLIPKGTGQIKITNLFTTTAAISGGTINGTVIGGSTPAAITGTSITGSGTVQGATLVGTAAITGASISVTGAITGTSITGLTTPLTVVQGGTGDSSLTAYAVVCGGTTNTSAIQSIASVGASGQILTSNGASALPTFQAAPLAISYASAEYDATNNNTLANVPGLTANVASGHTYLVEFNLTVTVNTASGCKIAIGGTATATNGINAFAYGLNGTALSNMTQTAAASIGSIILDNPASNTQIGLIGWATVVVSVGGTLTMQFAQHTSSATTASVLIGSIFKVTLIV